MKGCLVGVLVVLLALCAWNWWEIRGLREEIAGLRAKVDQRQAGGLTDALASQAWGALAEVRSALSGPNIDRARATLDEAQRKVEDVARAAGDKAAPSVRWLQEQAADLGRQVQDRVRGGH